MTKPYRLDGEAAPASPAVIEPPSNPLRTPGPVAREMSGWAPGIGQNTAEIRKGDIPWPKVTAEDSAGKE